eukprot:scaffold76920_cov32-Tisochrysis_lutea.AAC.2
MWSNLSVSSAAVSWAPPCTSRTASRGRYFRTSTARSAPVAGARSDGLSSATFPAANAPTSGSSSSLTGKLYAPMISTTPLGSGRTKERPSAHSCTAGLSAAHPSSCSSAMSMLSTPSISPSRRGSPPPRSSTSAFASAAVLSE